MTSKKKFITTTLPYINNSLHRVNGLVSAGHIGHCFEFVLGDAIADYYRYKLGSESVFLNVGIDEMGQKIYDRAIEEGLEPQEYCDRQAENWKEFCALFKIDYDNFYRTASEEHAKNAQRFFEEIKHETYVGKYEGNYCVGCEAFLSDKEILNGRCIIHQSPVEELSENNIFFNLNKFAPLIKDILIDKSLSKELSNILQEKFEFSITRQNVPWGVDAGNGQVFYTWHTALQNYFIAAGYYRDRNEFNDWWADSLQICGKDNLKFQAYIFQALLLAAGIPQTSELLVHGTILDEKGVKMSKTLGNVIDPLVQLQKFGLSPLRYYITCGLNTFGDSRYSEEQLALLWNADIVNGFGNLVSRVLHLVDIRNVELKGLPESQNKKSVEAAFERYDFNQVRTLLNEWVKGLNSRINNERPFEDRPESPRIINELYQEAKALAEFYGILLKGHRDEIEQAFVDNRKVILFERL